jgi:hypothetical protein
VLIAIRPYLKRGARVVFNIMANPSASPKNDELVRQLITVASEYFGTSQFAFGAIMPRLVDVRKSALLAGYRVLLQERKEHHATWEEFCEFLKIPIMSAPILPQLTYSQKMAALDAAYNSIRREGDVTNFWDYFVCAPS